MKAHTIYHIMGLFAKTRKQLRVVFDGSAKPDNSNVSINDCLEKRTELGT